MVNNGRPEWPRACCENLKDRHAILRAGKEGAQTSSVFMRVSRSRCLVRKERQIALARGDAKLEMMARSMNNSDGSSDLQFTTKHKTTA
jgi:hypothetical protein